MGKLAWLSPDPVSHQGPQMHGFPWHTPIPSLPLSLLPFLPSFSVHSSCNETLMSSTVYQIGLSVLGTQQ